MMIKMRKTRKKKMKNTKNNSDLLLNSQRKNLIFSMKFPKKMKNYLKMSIEIMVK